MPAFSIQKIRLQAEWCCTIVDNQTLEYIFLSVFAKANQMNKYGVTCNVTSPRIFITGKIFLFLKEKEVHQNKALSFFASRIQCIRYDGWYYCQGR
jgi:hypothetical protein